MFITVMIAIIGVLYYMAKFSGEGATKKQVEADIKAKSERNTRIENTLCDMCLENEITSKVYKMKDSQLSEINNEFHEILCNNYRVEYLTKLSVALVNDPIRNLSTEEKLDILKLNRKNALLALMVKEGRFPDSEIWSLILGNGHMFTSMYDKEYYRLCLQELTKKHPELNLSFRQAINAREGWSYEGFGPFVF